ncbi:MAG TPA: hypothetical protein VK142_06770, partial [Bacillota bacterium]|nr:hypothetical protein [Bacillota bacterium]
TSVSEMISLSFAISITSTELRNRPSGCYDSNTLLMIQDTTLISSSPKCITQPSPKLPHFNVKNNSGHGDAYTVVFLLSVV